jgi:hypothetical protein
MCSKRKTIFQHLSNHGPVLFSGGCAAAVDRIDTEARRSHPFRSIHELVATRLQTVSELNDRPQISVDDAQTAGWKVICHRFKSAL